MSYENNTASARKKKHTQLDHRIKNLTEKYSAKHITRFVKRMDRYFLIP